jgi:CRP/FNR family transcriptional regulator, cyclic AMP receptor protein
MTAPGADRLAHVPLFEGLADADRARVAAWFEIREFAPSSSITHDGASGYSFFVVDQGSVRVEHEHRVLATLGPGDVFGEMAILSDGRRHADAVAETDVVVLCMFGTHFREMQTAYPEIDQRLQTIAAGRRDASTS